MLKQEKTDNYNIGFPDSKNYNVSFQNGSDYYRYVDSAQIRHEMLKMKYLFLIVVLFISLGLFFWAVGRYDKFKKNNTLDNLSDTTISINCNSGQFIGEDYLIVSMEIEAMGFTDIQCIPKKDLITGWIKHPGTTISISIQGNRNFQSGDTYANDSTVIIVYHDFSRK